MEMNETLVLIRDELFQGSAEYTKNQPDLFLSHRVKILAPSQVPSFAENVKAALAHDPEFLLYVHVPFCFSECLFCNTFPHKSDPVIQKNYLQNLVKEIELFSQQGFFKGRKAKGVYFGGGTPTSFANQELKLILDTISSCMGLSDGWTVTSEAHPATLADKKRVQELAHIGINRLSIGCQTFDEDVLRLCNRKNSAHLIEKTVREVQDAGMAINIDMMTGLPGQTLEGVRRDLGILEKIRPNAVEYIRHEIVNPLIIQLYKDNPGLVVSDDTLFEMVYVTQEWMRAHGYQQNGSFTDDRQWGYRYYWLKEMPIIAFGSRARSYARAIFFDKHEELSTYDAMLKKGMLPIGRYIYLTEREQMYRSLFLGLQFADGLDCKKFQERFTADAVDVFSSLLLRLTEYGCLQQENGRIRLTKYGAYFVEDVCDHIIDTLLQEGPEPVARAPHSEGSKPSLRLS